MRSRNSGQVLIIGEQRAMYLPKRSSDTLKSAKDDLLIILSIFQQRSLVEGSYIPAFRSATDEVLRPFL